MKLRELARTAALEIAAHKTRSALTCLSLAVGVAAALFTFSAVGGMNRRLSTALELAGPGRLTIQQKRGYVSKGLSKGLTWQDAKEIRRLWPDLHMVYPMQRRWQTKMRLPGWKTDGIVIWGTTEEWSRRDWVYTLRGRWLTNADVENAARVCVLLQPGGWVEKPFWAKFFPEQELEKFIKRRDLLGAEISLDDRMFTVVGVLKEPPKDKDPRWGHSSYGGSGNILVPITTYQRYLIPPYDKKGVEKVQEIFVDTGDQQTAGSYLRRIETFLTARHRGEKDFEIKDYRQLIEGRMKRMRERAVTILAIGIVAILAGGIGIMNVTLATIYSRIREIGIRRSLGATRLDIVSQFVTEAVSLGVLSGAAGTLLGILAIQKLAPDPADMAPITALHTVLALAIAMGTGFFFSLFPAYQASRMDPIEALRYE